MPINFRSNSTNVPDGSITEAKLAPNSVSASKIQSDAVIESKIANDAISSAKIQDEAIVEDKIAPDSVSIAKVSYEVSTQHFLGIETEITSTGIAEVSVGEFNFHKDTTNQIENWKTLGFSYNLKSDDTGNNARLRIYIDGAIVHNGVQVNNTSYQYESNDAVDISTLADGPHLVEIKLSNDTVTGVATSNHIEIYLSKK